MRRRRFLASTCAATVGLAVAPLPAAGSTGGPKPPGVVWRRTYDDFLPQRVVPAHGGGLVVVDRGHQFPDPNPLIRVILLDETGEVRRRRRIDPDLPDVARRAWPDLIRTDTGYAVATGTWFARLDRELSVETTGFAPGYVSNRWTQIIESSDGFVVARSRNTSERKDTRVLQFGPDGELRWTQQYGEEDGWDMATLGFLRRDPQGGVVVGGPKGEPWLAGLGPDGERQWQTTVSHAPPRTGGDATIDADGITLTGGSGLVRLTPDRSINWQHSYDALGAGGPHTLGRTTDGGYVMVASGDGPGFALGRADASGRLRWAWEYSAGEEAGPSQVAKDVVERSPGEYLVVGAAFKDEFTVARGWAMLLSASESPPPTPTPSPTPTDFPTASPTETAEPTTVPGFGIGAALAGLAGGWLARRR